MTAKKLISILLTFIICFGVLSSAFATENKTPSSEIPEDYTPIYTAEDLNNIRNNLSGKYILMNDIDLSVYESWVPIGNSLNSFVGILDGNSFVVKNFKITKAEGENPSVGLFGTAKYSQIKDLTVVGTINVHNNNGIRAGLICGEAYCSAISNCTTFGKLVASTNAGAWVGGITGYLSENLEDESNKSTIKGCRNNAEIIADVFRNEDFFGMNYFTGGVVGLSIGAISECSNYGNVFAMGKSDNSAYYYAIVGGICGNSNGEIKNCYNIGKINSAGAKYTLAGGIAGYWYQFGDIINCYNIGQVESESEKHTDEYKHSLKGGIIGGIEGWIVPAVVGGDDYECKAKVKNCYYLNNIENAFGDGVPVNQENVKALTKDGITNQEAFVGFDFENIWEMSKIENRPMLCHSSEVFTVNIKTKTGKTVAIDNIDKQSMVSWSSANEKIAVITDSGEIKGISAGTTDVIIMLNDGSVVECSVTVEFSLIWWLINLLLGWIKRI